MVGACHVGLGATVAAVFEHWTTLADPSGVLYCISTRNSKTGRIAGKA